MTISKVTSNGITDSAVTTAKITDANVTEAKLASDSVVTGKITDGTIAAGDLASSLDLTGKTVTLPNSATSSLDQNIALLGFKMAVNEGLTVFNLVDGIVDEFHDESGTDEGEGSNDTYDSSCDFYQNITAPVSGSAGFSTTAITEPTTSTAGTNPAAGSGTSGAFTVPTGVTSVDMQVWGASGAGNTSNPQNGGAGGYAEGTLAVTATQSLHVLAGEGGRNYASSVASPFLNGGGGPGNAAGGGGLAGVFSVPSPQLAHPQPAPGRAPSVYLIGGSGGAAGGGSPSPEGGGHGGAGGGLIGDHGNGQGEQTNRYSSGADAGYGGGGSQTAGGQAGLDPEHGSGVDGAFLKGASTPGGNSMAGGGAGYYGGGTGDDSDGATSYAAGGGSSYHGHPQITSGSTEEGTGPGESGGATQPGYVADTGEGAGPNVDGEDGFTLITYNAPGSTASTTIVSNAFTAGSAPSTSRIVIFQENVDSITLNTDIVASVSRDGGSNFSTATLSDSGYVTGSSGQRILTGIATVSGQPSGTSMRWKLALANNKSKVHGVSLQWK